MHTIKKISGGVAFLTFALALPVAAEDQVTTKHKVDTGLQPISTKRVMPVRTNETPQTMVIEASLPTPPQNEPMPSAGNMPYITYDGASNSAQ